MLRLCLLAGFCVFLQASEKEVEWEVNQPHGEVIPVKFTTTEGTWMNLDISPDGSQIVFDLLGDIYVMPIGGGKARLLLGDSAMDLQPRFSPDGRWISFTSDRAGGDNLWVMDREGKNLRQISKEKFRLLNNPVWTPDSQYLIARKHFTSGRSLGAGEMWMYHISGGDGLQLTKRKNDQQDAGEPDLSPDGRFLYYSEDVSPGPDFEYNKDPNEQIYIIKELDLQTGKTRNLITGSGGAARPRVSPDGTQIAFVRRVRGKSVLFVYERSSGIQRPLFEGLSHDQQEAWAVFGIYPGFAWTPDGKRLVFWAKGGIHALELASGKVNPIPFEAEVEKQIQRSPRFQQEVSPDSFEAKMIRDAVVSPDGKTLVFSAIGHLWQKNLPDGEPKRLTGDAPFEYTPVFSPDGRTLVFTTWDDADLGSVSSLDLASGKSRKLTTRPGYYHEPAFSPDGKKIVYRRSSGSGHLGFAHGLDTGLYLMDSDGNNPSLIQENGRNPQFDPSGKRVYFLAGFGLDKEYRSVGLDAGDSRTHFNLKYVNQVVPSPDGRWLAFTELFNVYITPFPKTGSPISLDKNTRAVPVARVSKDVGDYLSWSASSDRLYWMVGNQLHSRSLTDSFSFLEGAPEKLPDTDLPGIGVGLKVKTDVPEGTLAFKGATIITMNGDRVIENGTLIVVGNRIADLGPADEVVIPAGALVVDGAGKTLMPGIVDVHAHARHFGEGPLPQTNWPYYANLAYGVTTAHDPSATTEMVFSFSEMVKAGIVVGPRIYSTGVILYGADTDFKAEINSLEDARSHLRRMKASGAFSVKSYNQPRRDQKQQILQAAHENNMLVVNEGGSTFYHNLTMILDGTTGIEHNLPVAPLYNDVLSLWAASEVGYTPTLVVSFGGVSGEYYWYQHSDVWAQERLLKYYPRPQIDARSRRRLMLPENEWYYQEVARSVKALLDRGVKVQLGAHGQLQGLAAHWELWMMAQGGMTPLEALRVATLNGAQYLGLDKDLGSLEKGKLADLLLLSANPLQDIRNSEKIEQVMVNGRLYDTETMNQIGNHPKDRGLFYWERHGDGSQYGADFSSSQGCSCGRH